MSERSESPGPEQQNKVAIGVLRVVGNLAVGITVLAAPFVIIPWLPRHRFGALPYLNTSAKRVAMAMSLIESAVGKGRLGVVASGAGAPRARRFMDLGSGDGVIAVEAARRGMQASGVELNPVLVGVSWIQAELSGVGYVAHALRNLSRSSEPSAASSVADVPPGGKTARFWVGNLFHTRLQEYDCVMCFGVAPMMPALSNKLGSDLSEGSLVVMNRFRLPEEDGWEIDGEVDTIAIYRVTSTVKANCGTAERH
jgi:hypothetical protein